MQVFLKIEDLDELLTALLPCATEWSILGLKLKLNYDTDLQPIKYQAHHNQTTALREMLARVLYKKKVTWQMIVDALRLIGRDNLADDIIQKKHLQPMEGIIYNVCRSH